MSSYILWQLQLSNYDKFGRFILSADSNWQIFLTKAINMVKHDKSIKIDVIVPKDYDYSSGSENPANYLQRFNLENNVRLIKIKIAGNALRTRFDFNWEEIEHSLDLKNRDYSHVYINDPLLLRHYKAMFYLAKKKPKFITQAHFLDSPLARIVDDEADAVKLPETRIPFIFGLVPSPYSI